MVADGSDAIAVSGTGGVGELMEVMDAKSKDELAWV